MAKSAQALKVVSQSIEDDMNGHYDLVVTLSVCYSDDVIAYSYSRDVPVRYPVTSTPNQIRTAMTDTIIAAGTDLTVMPNPGVEVVANEIILPDLSRG